mmetsp:Transcript_11209/g.26344  ORF Transcript_11209/g.26344 Transcript_11209/m.26344 type:complete len:221 (-) Transcript_11209:183-845(-)
MSLEMSSSTTISWMTGATVPKLTCWKWACPRSREGSFELINGSTLSYSRFFTCCATHGHKRLAKAFRKMGSLSETALPMSVCEALWNRLCKAQEGFGCLAVRPLDKRRNMSRYRCRSSSSEASKALAIRAAFDGDDGDFARSCPSSSGRGLRRLPSRALLLCASDLQSIFKSKQPTAASVLRWRGAVTCGSWVCSSCTAGSGSVAPVMLGLAVSCALLLA